jgi:hypothetical protein
LPCIAHPPPLIVLSATHPLFYLNFVCWIGGDGTWLPIRCLALSTPSLSPCYLPPTCFASCSTATSLPHFLIVVCWLMSLPCRDRHYTPDKFLFLALIPSIFFYSVTKAFFRYNSTSRHEIVLKNHTSFCVTETPIGNVNRHNFFHPKT